MTPQRSMQLKGSVEGTNLRQSLKISNMHVVISNISTNRFKKGSITNNKQKKRRIAICLKLYSFKQWDKEEKKEQRIDEAKGKNSKMIDFISSTSLLLSNIRKLNM